MYGATLHVSRLNETPESHMEGGAFYANTRGLDHYKVPFAYGNRSAIDGV